MLTHHANLLGCTHRFLSRKSQWSPMTTEQRSDGQRKKEAEGWQGWRERETEQEREGVSEHLSG